MLNKVRADNNNNVILFQVCAKYAKLSSELGSVSTGLSLLLWCLKLCVCVCVCVQLRECRRVHTYSILVRSHIWYIDEPHLLQETYYVWWRSKVIWCQQRSNSEDLVRIIQYCAQHPCTSGHFRSAIRTFETLVFKVSSHIGKESLSHLTFWFLLMLVKFIIWSGYENLIPHSIYNRQLV